MVADVACQEGLSIEMKEPGVNSGDLYLYPGSGYTVWILIFEWDSPNYRYMVGRKFGNSIHEYSQGIAFTFKSAHILRLANV